MKNKLFTLTVFIVALASLVQAQTQQTITFEGYPFAGGQPFCLYCPQGVAIFSFVNSYGVQPTAGNTWLEFRADAASWYAASTVFFTNPGTTWTGARRTAQNVSFDLVVPEPTVIWVIVRDAADNKLSEQFVLNLSGQVKITAPAAAYITMEIPFGFPKKPWRIDNLRFTLP